MFMLPRDGPSGLYGFGPEFFDANGRVRQCEYDSLMVYGLGRESFTDITGMCLVNHWKLNMCEVLVMLMIELSWLRDGSGIRSLRPQPPSCCH